MIGKKLVPALLQKGYKVSMLSRHAKPLQDTRVFLWNVENQTIDTGCFEGVTAIIHLAGENIAGAKWTEKRKKQIIESRVKSTELLYHGMAQVKNDVSTFISASAVGYYGDRNDEPLVETSENGKGFLASTCAQWEAAVDQGSKAGLRIVKLRTGFILDKHDGGLPVMAKPIQFWLAAPLGSGKQWVPWIHLTDMVNMYIHTLENPLTGTFNACAPSPVTNRTLTKELAEALHRPVWPLSVPAPVIKAIIGEMSEVVLTSTNTSAQKMLDAGFRFKFNLLQDALADIYNVK